MEIHTLFAVNNPVLVVAKPGIIEQLQKNSNHVGCFLASNYLQ